MTTKKTKALFQIRDFDALDMLREYLDEFCDDWDIFFINLDTGEIYDDVVVKYIYEDYDEIEKECQIIVDAEGDISQITFMCYLLEKRLQNISQLERSVKQQKIHVLKETENISYESMLKQIRSLIS